VNDDFELKTAPLGRDEAMDLYRQMEIFVPANGYPIRGSDLKFAPDPIHDPSPWNYGKVGTSETIDLDFETKSGGPWGVWVVSDNRHLYVAARQDAPIDRLLYFVSRRVTCSIHINVHWSRMVAAAALAGYTQIGTVQDYGVWTRQVHDYFIFNA